MKITADNKSPVAEKKNEFHLAIKWNKRKNTLKYTLATLYVFKIAATEFVFFDMLNNCCEKRQNTFQCIMIIRDKFYFNIIFKEMWFNPTWWIQITVLGS